MTIHLPADLEAAIAGEAKRLGVSADRVVEETMRLHLITKGKLQIALDEPRDEWERELRALAIPCGVSLSNEDLSSEGLYD
jgi:hypothetical protein